MKKFILSAILLGSLAFANDIKNNNFFVRVDGGVLKVHDSNGMEGISAGYYFYDPNEYKINNRIYIDFKKVNSDADFYVTSLKLDWIKNTSTLFAPFVGINVGYLYFDDNGDDYSTGVWGGELGLLVELKENLNLNLEFCYQKAFDKQDIWNTPLKTFKAGLEIDF